ncbi:uncharacterized protein [Acropora muricata]|uniref:uncharacterized protein n=1 Tax=Acropora muricata TaxID=159855 RepID=UPI0034E57674
MHPTETPLGVLLPYQFEAKAENCSKTQCLLLPVGDDLVASEFRLKSSEKGVRLVYINLVIGNSSYDPLELPDEFLPNRWVWANTIHEPMLSLPEDYDILSAGLLNYQVRSIQVKLKDQPSGCLAKLNSTCQNLAVGRMLLENVTSSTSGEKLHKKEPVVCVAVISRTCGGVRYNCCDMHKKARTGSATIRCDQRLDDCNWMGKVTTITVVLFSCLLALFAPALPLAIPKYVFSLEDEVEKENRQAELTNMKTTAYERIAIPVTVGDQNNQRETGADQSKTEDVALHAVSSTDTSTTSTATANDNNNSNNYNNNNNHTIQEETGQNTSNCVANSQDQDEENEFIPVDDSSPMNVSTLLLFAVGAFFMTKILNYLGIQGKRFIWIFIVVPCFFTIYMKASLFFFTNSCLFITIVAIYLIIGLALNVSIVTPFLAFFLVLTTNVYLCYAKMQSKYKEVKKMISERLQELHMNSNVPKDTIRADIYWFVCDMVLPIKSEMCRMLRNMVLVIAFLFLALFSIVSFGNEKDISTLTTTISVFFTGLIPTFLKVLTRNSNVIGRAKIKMERKIEKAVKEYRDSRNGEAVEQILETLV